MGTDISQEYWVQYDEKGTYLKLIERFVEVISKLFPQLKDFSSEKIRLWIPRVGENDSKFEEAKLWHDSASMKDLKTSTWFRAATSVTAKTKKVSLEPLLNSSFTIEEKNFIKDRLIYIEVA